MGVICFASLKGGVGKTSLAVNTAHAFAERGCQTLVIDCDPAGHTTRLLSDENANGFRPLESPLARLFLSIDETEKVGSIIDTSLASGVRMLMPARNKLDILCGGAELRHFLWGRGARKFGAFFPRLISELQSSYDYIIIDSQPDYNVITRNAIACADLVVVPVDSSAMSIHCLEELISSTNHIQGPAWAIIRSMQNRVATSVHRLSADRLKENLSLQASNEGEDDDMDRISPNADDFMSLLREHERLNSGVQKRNDQINSNPIYLLNAGAYRTEEQNKLTFCRKTAFDSSRTSGLAKQYREIAKELEFVLSMVEDSEEELPMDEYMPSAVVGGRV